MASWKCDGELTYTIMDAWLWAEIRLGMRDKLRPSASVWHPRPSTVPPPSITAAPWREPCIMVYSMQGRLRGAPWKGWGAYLALLAQYAGGGRW